MNIRPAAVAGQFYPDSKPLLEAAIDAAMQSASIELPAKAIIAPHAGYIYSGDIAASAYASVLHQQQSIKRIIILGPAHRVYVKGMAFSTADYFETPLGNLHLDKRLQTELLQLPDTLEFDQTHEQEHSIEVHLPFLQTLFGEFSLVPIVVGDISADSVCNLINHLWSDENLIIISSDLSHFLNYSAATRMDQQTASHIENFATQHIGPKQACGCRPVNGLLQFANNHNMKIDTLDLRNSGDTSGNKERVVGYGAFGLH